MNNCTINFGSHHHLFIIYPHIQLSYDQYKTFFDVHPILIHGHLMKNQMALSMIIIYV